jgi:hypothetical protein
MVAGVLVGDKGTVDTAGTPSRGHLHYAGPRNGFTAMRARTMTCVE